MKPNLKVDLKLERRRSVQPFHRPGHLPSFAGDDSHLLQLPLWRHMPGLPPLIVGGIYNMENVPKLKVQTLTGQPRVLGLIIVKQSSAEQDMKEISVCLLVTKKRALLSPDIERSLLAGPQRSRAWADAAVHHLLAQVVDLCLEAAVL